MRHPNADVLIAIAEWRAVQYRLAPGAWMTYGGIDSLDVNPANVNTPYQWRIKPAVLRYRVALMRAGNTVYTTTSMPADARLENADGFVRWLGDWQEVEV